MFLIQVGYNIIYTQLQLCHVPMRNTDTETTWHEHTAKDTYRRQSRGSGLSRSPRFWNGGIVDFHEIIISYTVHRCRLGGSPGARPPIFENRPCIYQFLPHSALPIFRFAPPIFLKVYTSDTVQEYEVRTLQKSRPF